MAHVIGIPLIKGNSEEIVTVKIDNGLDGAFPVLEGMAGFWKTGAPRNIQPTIVAANNPDSSGGFAGFVMDINNCALTASMIYETALVALPADTGDAWTAGERITIDLATSFISKQGTTTNMDGYIDTYPVTGVNGKTGDRNDNCVLVQILSNKQDYPPVVVAAAAKKAAAPKTDGKK